MLLGARAGVQVAAATPPELRPDPDIVAQAGELASVVDDPREAAAGAHALYTDVWVSMGDEQDASRRRELLAPYRLDAELLAHARDDAVVMHCLPAHPGRGDHRGPAVRRALGGLGPGREQAARAEGADGAPARLSRAALAYN